MIRHIFKLIWNERKTNMLIVMEFILVFCILWFCCAYLWFTVRRYFEPRGFDIEHTYCLHMGIRPDNALTEEQREQSRDELGNVMKLIERVECYPGIEAVSISNSAMPYSQSYSGASYAVDTIILKRGNVQIKAVSPAYFDMFRIKLEKGRVFDWPDPGNDNAVIITPDNKGEFMKVPADRVERFYSYMAIANKLAPDITAVGVTTKIKGSFDKCVVFHMHS
jgi:putative ABC transport system permease protein